MWMIKHYVGEDRIVMKNFLQRKSNSLIIKNIIWSTTKKGTSWIIFTKFVKEYVSLLLYEDGSSVLEFKSDGGVKLRYDMEVSILYTE